MIHLPSIISIIIQTSPTENPEIMETVLIINRHNYKSERKLYLQISPINMGPVIVTTVTGMSSSLLLILLMIEVIKEDIGFPIGLH